MKKKLGEKLKMWAIPLCLVVGVLAVIGGVSFCQASRDWVEVSTYANSADYGISVHACNPLPGRSKLDVVIVNDCGTTWAYDGPLYAISVQKLIDGKWYKCEHHRRNEAKTAELYTIGPQSVALYEADIYDDVGWLEAGGRYRVALRIQGDYEDRTSASFVLYDTFTVRGVGGSQYVRE